MTGALRSSGMRREWTLPRAIATRNARPPTRRMIDMSAQVLDGKKVSAQVRAEVAARVQALAGRGVQPGLAVVLVGADPASEVYVRNKTKACREVGAQVFDHHLPAD